MKSRSQESCAPADPARAHGSTEAKEHEGLREGDGRWMKEMCVYPGLLGRGIRNKDSRKESCVALRYEINSSLGGGDEVIASRLNFLDAWNPFAS